MELTKNQRKINWYRCPFAARDAQLSSTSAATFGGYYKRWGIWVCWRRRAQGLGTQRSTWPCRGCC